MWLAANAPERVDRLVAHVHLGDARRGARLAARAAKLVREQGTGAVAEATRRALVHAGVPPRPTPTPSRSCGRRSPTRRPRATPAAATRSPAMDLLDAIGPRSRADARHRRAAHDPATPPPHAELIAERIPGARLELVDAAHLANIELRRRGHARSIALPPGGAMNDDAAPRAGHGASAGRCSATPTSTARSRTTTELTAPFQDFITRDGVGRRLVARRPRPPHAQHRHARRALTALRARERDRDARARGDQQRRSRRPRSPRSCCTPRSTRACRRRTRRSRSPSARWPRWGSPRRCRPGGVTARARPPAAQPETAGSRAAPASFCAWRSGAIRVDVPREADASAARR